MRKALVLWSGGLDSTAVLIKALEEYTDYEIGAVFFDYNQLARGVELNALRELTRYIRRYRKDIEHRFLGFKTYVVPMSEHIMTGGESQPLASGFAVRFMPMRNTVFACLAYNYARHMGADLVMIGVCMPIVGDPESNRFPDCTELWVRMINDIYANENTTAPDDSYKVRLEAPFVNMSKKELYNDMLLRDIPIRMTWSCDFPRFRGQTVFGPRDVPCGECPKCTAKTLLP